MSALDQSVICPEPTTTGEVDGVATLLERSSIILRLVGDSFGADHDGRGRRRSRACWLVGDLFRDDHDGRGRRRRRASWPHVGRRLL